MANPCQLREKSTRVSNRFPIKHQQEVFSPSKPASDQVQAHPSDTLSTTYRHIVSESYIMFIYTLALLHLSLLHTLCPVIIYHTMLANKEQLHTAAVKMELGLSGLDHLDMRHHPITNIKSSNRNKRRFSDEQIRSLEVMFESDSRPESLIKQQLANELGLQPRQIAIWFQNRRARSKAKQIERDYNVLKESYDALSSSYESLKRENQSLRIQLQKLKGQLEMEHENQQHYGPNRADENSGNAKPENGSTILDTNEKVTILFEGYDRLLPCDDNSRNVESKGGDRVALDMIEATNGSLTSSEKWCRFESNCFLDESSCSSNWWEYW
ncbi:hypothetical protein Golax_006534 [Gossypium laxum]|uniref:Homeobox-leucine zipper protein n=1 Tax=Gossypium laxum TaxID=34288 RepID=A0A7J9A433_9ROSI|nr:hypothetical protein [Gossypium laxum]